MKKDEVKIFLRLKGKIYRSSNVRSFSGRLLKLVKNKKPFPKVYLKVTYGKFKDTYGKMTTFYNDGYYDNWKEFKKAYDAFVEK